MNTTTNAARSIVLKSLGGYKIDDGGRHPAGGFRIVFSQEAPGPLCLGHSCHSGLGIFLPAGQAE